MKKPLLHKVFVLSLCASFAFVSCVPDIPWETGDPEEPEEIEYYLSVSPSGSVSFPAEGGEIDFSARTNADNTECSYPKNDWLTATYNKSSKSYIVTVTANETGNDREFKLTFNATLKKSGEKVATEVVYATQPAMKVSNVSVAANPATLEFTAEGGAMSTVVTWSEGVNKLRAIATESTKSWIKLEWKNSDGQKLLVLTAAANDTGAERSGIVDLYAGITSEDIESAKNGDLDPSRAARIELTVKQQAGSSVGPGPGDVPDGALAGLFSVDGYGHQVLFSQGNLQYQASTGTWRFAGKQWDYIGNDNSNIGKSYSGWIDLFGWGTSGYDCGNFFYRPYDYELVDDYYYSGGLQYGPKGETTLTGSNAKSDWGVYNAISNGGNKAGLWRTLTYEELDYLVFNRNTTSGIRFAKAVVNNVNGLILFPDNWNKSTYSINEANEDYVNYSVNKISSSNWSKLEDAGCVFLPAAGVRYVPDYELIVNLMTAVGTSGEYWTASGKATVADACHLLFYDEGMQFRDWPRYEGRSVRLVQDK